MRLPGLSYKYEGQTLSGGCIMKSPAPTRPLETTLESLIIIMPSGLLTHRVQPLTDSCFHCLRRSRREAEAARCKISSISTRRRSRYQSAAGHSGTSESHPEIKATVIKSVRFLTPDQSHSIPIGKMQYSHVSQIHFPPHVCCCMQSLIWGQ